MDASFWVGFSIAESSFRGALPVKLHLQPHATRNLADPSSGLACRYLDVVATEA